MISLAPKLTGQILSIEDWVTRNIELLMPMDDVNLAFLEALSNDLMKRPEAKVHAELVALGFWLRKRNIQYMFESSLCQTSKVMHKPLGTVVHFTPANVDTMFVYSWVCSLLCGNNNIVRVATAQSDIKDVLLNTLDRLFHLPQFASVAKRNWFVSYDISSGFSEKLSKIADARVIWGGDDSVNNIRALPCKPRCRDISFSDRFSATLLDLRNVNENQNTEELALKLWRDSMPYQQQACSSPRIIYFLGDTSVLHRVLVQLNKHSYEQDRAITQKNNQLVNTQLAQSIDQDCEILLRDRICAIKVSAITQDRLEWHNGENVFYVRHLDKPEAMFTDFLDKLQTLSYWGVSEQEKLKVLSHPSISGIDRVVPVGLALEFGPQWDGFDLTTQLSRVVTVK